MMDDMQIAKQCRILSAALSISKAQVTAILCAGADGINIVRLMTIRHIIYNAGIGLRTKLNARFVQRKIGDDGESLIDLLAADPLDIGNVTAAIATAKLLSDAAAKKAAARESRWAALGYKAPRMAARRENINRILWQHGQKQNC
jgi:hypothetical protein